jgi:hypothetical protein
MYLYEKIEKIKLGRVARAGFRAARQARLVWTCEIRLEGVNRRNLKIII